MSNIQPLSPQSVFTISEDLVLIPGYIAQCKSITAQSLFERVHIDVLRYIASPSEATLSTAVESIEYAAGVIDTYRSVHARVNSDDYSAAHNILFRYNMLKRQLDIVNKVQKLEESEA